VIGTIIISDFISPVFDNSYQLLVTSATVRDIQSLLYYFNNLYCCHAHKRHSNPGKRGNCL